MKTIVLFAMLALSSTLGGCGLLGSGVDKYDILVDKDEACSQAWSDIDANLVRRSDLIPNLVAIAKGYAAHERGTLDEVIAARASATQVKLDYKADDFSDPVKMQQFQAAQSGLSQALGKLMMVREAYPDLKANEQFNTLMTQTESTENRILQARRVYNAAAASYNTELRHVSGKIINPLTGHEFRPRVYFGADDNAKVAPKVDFSAPVVK